MANMTPMMRQYLEMKDKYPGMILFFRLGDFYEMFFDDAKLVSRELELTLTGKSCGMEERAPMCGVPFHSAETYINRLIETAICCPSAWTAIGQAWPSWMFRRANFSYMKSKGLPFGFKTKLCA